MTRSSSNIRVLIGCECSGRVRDAFLAREFDAWSCDIKPDEHGSNRHITDDVRVALSDYGPWDMAFIAHPPCTALANSGVRWLKSPPPGKTLAEMQQRLVDGCALFSECWNADVPHVACENPIMHKYARALVKNYQPPHYVQPYWFGDPWTKKTGLFLRNLPKLRPTNMLTPPKPGTDDHKAWSVIHRAPPGPDRQAFRSRTPQGLADAIAHQWGDHLLAQTERCVA